MPKIRIRVREDAREIEVEGERKAVEEILKQYGFGPGGTPQAQHKEKPTDVSKAMKQAAVGGKVSAAEFILQQQLKKHTDIVLGFGYYLDKHKGLSKFTPGDINNAYYEARMEPSNTSQMIIQNMKRGFLMEDRAAAKAGSGRNYYTLTQTGIRYVESGFKKTK